MLSRAWRCLGQCTAAASRELLNHNKVAEGLHFAGWVELLAFAVQVVVECVSACRPSWSFHCLPCDQLNSKLLCCLQAVFVLPTAYPVTSETLNYSGVAVGIVLFGSLAWWFFPIKSGRFAGARYWYTGGPNMSRQCFFKRCCKFYLETIY